MGLPITVVDAFTDKPFSGNPAAVCVLERDPERPWMQQVARELPGFDFVSRFFAPQVGVPEDPVTGSAHCALAPYWAQRLGKSAMLAYQVSARGGVVSVEVKGDRVLLGGQAVTVWRGELMA